MAADGNRRHWLPGGVGRLGPPNCRGVCHSRGRGVLVVGTWSCCSSTAPL
jgi:hypothetical protein